MSMCNMYHSMKSYVFPFDGYTRISVGVVSMTFFRRWTKARCVGMLCLCEFWYPYYCRI